MTRRLSRTVVSGGVVYPAGATLPDHVAERVVADVWVDDSEESKPAPAKKTTPKRAKSKD